TSIDPGPQIAQSIPISASHPASVAYETAPASASPVASSNASTTLVPSEVVKGGLTDRTESTGLAPAGDGEGAPRIPRGRTPPAAGGVPRGSLRSLRSREAPGAASTRSTTSSATIPGSN